MSTELADYHIHTSLCNHANGTMKQFARFAMAAGLMEIGFADHSPLPSAFDSHYRMLPEELTVYQLVIQDLQRFFETLNIRIGIELDYISSATGYLHEFVGQHHFDYVIGSVHYLHGNANGRLCYLNDFRAAANDNLYYTYFQQVKAAANSGLFDIIAHFDLPRRFWGLIDKAGFLCAAEALETIKSNDLCLEINTSGFRTKCVLEPFPGRTLLHLIREMKIPITLGSDAHIPGDVGSYFSEAIHLLKEIGFTEICFFKNRRREARPI
ncbi:MAG: histidinol-phosphatase HisJ family protein [candidate division KSB1 bacterium]|nr:histidinol-phosphatase HisJ family protein [candidate division KSB1 bacterium]